MGLKNRKVLLMLLVLSEFLLCGICFSQTEKEQVNVVFIDSGYAPFHITPASPAKRIEKGIVVEILREFEKEYPYYKVSMKELPKKRLIYQMDKGEADMTYNSPLFTGKNSENFIWSDPFIESKDYVVMLKNNRFAFEKPEDLFGKTIGKIRGFGYGEYDSYFKEGKISGYDSEKTIYLIRMLKIGRLDGFLGNIHVTPYEMGLHNEKRENFYFPETPIYKFELGFQINKNRTKLKDDLNRFIKGAREDGLLKKIEAKYL
ncbi:MAG: transporter substrate-binding domain-containing protein [Desulfamplus sp.]|nr:transporter substrate-binding domain-containing protein [Desulfamplus sp.]